MDDPKYKMVEHGKKKKKKKKKKSRAPHCCMISGVLKSSLFLGLTIFSFADSHT
jgi:hypothetical protein